MLNSANSKGMVATEEIENYMPGDVALNTKDRGFQHFLLRQYVIGSAIKDMHLPAISDHTICVMETHSPKTFVTINGGEEEELSLSKHEFMIKPAFHSFSNWHSEPIPNTQKYVSMLVINLAPLLLNKSLVETCNKDSAHLDIYFNAGFQDPLMQQLIFAIRDEAGFHGCLNRVYMETAAQMFSIQLIKHYHSRCCTIREYNSKLSTVRLRRVLDYVHAHLEQELSLEKMAELAYMSTYHFAHMFKQTVGAAPHQYVLRCRMEKAKQLLKATDWSIMHIALKVGFKDSGYFSSAFKRHIGVTPANYRKSL